MLSVYRLAIYGSGEALAMEKNKQLMWCYLMHLGYNMWHSADSHLDTKYGKASTVLRFDLDAWNAIIDKLAASGFNTVVLDLGEGVKYESHPEIAAQGAWSIDFLRSELNQLRAKGITPIPKLNFATTHDEWLGEYSRRVCTPEYYQVCRDLIEEVCDVFDQPEFFHLGMDEEFTENQIHLHYAVIRQFDLWWHDMYFYIEACERKNVRAAVWSDCGKKNIAEYVAKMPKSVLQTNWYYWNYWDDVQADYIGMDAFQYNEKQIQGYKTHLDLFPALEKAGFEQIPSGSFWNNDVNFYNLTRYAQKLISPERLRGFMQTAWLPTVNETQSEHFRCIDVAAKAINKD